MGEVFGLGPLCPVTAGHSWSANHLRSLAVVGVIIIVPKFTIIAMVQCVVLKWLIFCDISVIAGICVLVRVNREQLWIALIVTFVAPLVLHTTISIDVGPWQFHAILRGLRSQHL